jgi:hypothetical protein
MRIERFDPKTDTERLRACFEMTQAGWPVDHPDEPKWSYGVRRQMGTWL